MKYNQYKKPQTAKLIDVSKDVRSQNMFRVRQAIYELFEEGKSISVTDVANRAGVSRHIVYDDKESLDLLNYFAKVLQNMPITAKDYRIDYDKEYKKIGSIQSLITSEEEIEKLLLENAKLKTRLSKLQFELDFYKKSGTYEQFKKL